MTPGKMMLQLLEAPQRETSGNVLMDLIHIPYAPGKTAPARHAGRKYARADPNQSAVQAPWEKAE